MANITVLQATTEFLQRKKDTSDIDNIPGTFLKWCNYVNRYLYRELANIMPETYIQEQTYTTYNGVSTYELPEDFQDIIPQGTGMFYVGQNNVPTDRRLPLTGYSSTANGMYLTLADIVFTPVPTQTNTWVFRYIPILPDLSGNSSEFLLPTRFSQHLMNALDAMYDVWDSDNQDEVFNNARVIATLQELVSLINPIGQAYGTPDFSQSY